MRSGASRRKQKKRKRRTAYSSGRKELIGYEVPEIVGRKKSRKVKKTPGQIDRTPLKSKHRWRKW